MVLRCSGLGRVMVGGIRLGFHGTKLSVYCAAVRLFAASQICVVWPEESLRDIEGLGVGAGYGWGVELLSFHSTILSVY